MKTVADLYGDDPEAADAAFGLDLVTGVYRPDMVYYVSNNTLNAVVKHKLYLDLSDYLVSDDDVCFDNLFGAARRIVTYRDTVWGLPAEIVFSGIVGRNDLLGDYAMRTGWTLEEELDFIHLLPEGITPIMGLRQDLVPAKLTGFYDLRAFVDFERMTCDFASPVSVSFLAYMASRPKTDEALERISPVDRISQIYSDEWIRMYRDGEIALSNFWFHDVCDYFGMYQLFFTNDTTMIGYPTQRPEKKYSGVVADISNGAITIMNDSKQEDACWAFAKYVIRNFTPATVLRDAFENRVSALDGTLFCYYDDGTKSFGVDRWEDKPGFRMVFHREDADRLRDIFEKGGEPWIIGYDESLGEIVKEEELSALCAGHITPEECGDRLQSRVSIWLNERK